MSICSRYKQITNADYMRQGGRFALMTDEEIAEEMVKEDILENPTISIISSGKIEDLRNSWLAWMRKPYKMED